MAEHIPTELLLIDGKRVASADGRSFHTVEPATGTVLADVALAGPEDVNRAVDAARAAFDDGPWPRLSATQRGRVLHRIAGIIRERQQSLAELETRNSGKCIADALDEVGGAANTFEYYAGAVDKLFGETIPIASTGLDLTLREPVGVAAQIVPWNFPIVMAAWKMAPALAVGCAVVLKPASLTPLTALALGQIALEAGVPPGVVNVIPGAGASAGLALAGHQRIDKVAFTGSTEVGREIMRAAAGNITRVSLELGGKSPCIVFADADLALASDRIPYSAFANAGQDCCARTRVFVQQSIAEEFIAQLVARTRQLRVGDPLDATMEMGSLVSAGQKQRSLDYIHIGESEGARVLSGGELTDHSDGHFLLPTLLGDVRNDMRVAREEIFGPVVCVIPFDDEDDVVRQVNDSPFGLSGSLWSRDLGRALRVARRIRTGVISVNSNSSVHVQAPFGGYKQSGIGRELGMHGLQLYSEVKNIFIEHG